MVLVDVDGCQNLKINALPPRRWKLHTKIQKYEETEPVANDGTCGFSEHWNPSANLLGGRLAIPDEVPWQVFISSETSTCGGSLISQDYVLTAGHCVRQVTDPTAVLIFLGGNILFSKRSSTYRVATEVVVHPNFTYYRGINVHDLALIKLNSPVEPNESIRPICMPETCAETCQAGEVAIHSGWGITNTGIIYLET